MKKILSNRIISVLLIISLLFSFSAFFAANAANEKKGILTHSQVRVRSGPGVDNDKCPPLVCNGETVFLQTGNEVIILDTVPSLIDDTANPYWHKIKFNFKGQTLEGYISAAYVKIIDDSEVIMPDGVPKEYESYVKTLLAQHPNWKFVFYDTKINWNDLFLENAQGYVGRSLIPYTSPVSYRSTQSGAYNWREDKWISQDAGPWYQANSQTIAYYMDPRNFLNESNVFMFEQLSYNKSSHNIDGVKSMLNGSFMADKEILNNNGDSILYAQAFIDAAEASGASPYHLVSRVIQEVGLNGSLSVSGTYSGYEGYYNFYNIGAYQGTSPIENALKYAKGEGVSDANKAKYGIPWDSQYKAIIGGAKWIAAGYIDRGQDTLYYQKYDTANGVYSHQYMGNIMAPMTESVKIKNSYEKLGFLDHGYTFIIPYYRNMPSKPCTLPAANNNSPNNWLKTLTVEGYTFNFDAGKTDGYTISVPGNVASVKISAAAVNANAKISGTGTVSLKDGDNTVSITVTAQNGDKRTYSLNIKRLAKIPLTGIELNVSSVSLFKGDSRTLTVSYLPSSTTDDKTVVWSTSNPSVATVSNGKITAIGEGEAVIKAKVGSFEKICTVTVAEKVELGDVDGDGVITIADALTVFKYVAKEIGLSATALKAADADRNGTVELADAIRIFKYVSREIDNL